ncbi:Mpp10 protein [Moelleriella libera RCEF 2490]|uniref:U3 small nucleolar ribonucleoprotein protein MPP10 n=1 Tax=Moelleriella libera RCEF 2490 TaxID=1081109 RepID=A0A168AUD9_9HYPO|nr:Mpp10 protein [Moelleriella libera RCEF 2490]
MASASKPSAKPPASAGMADFIAGLKQENRHKFLEPTASIPNTSLGLVKETLESVAAQASDLQSQRLKESRKRKRGESRGDSEALKLRKVYLDGFKTEQVWQQARKIINGVLQFTDRLTEELEEGGQVIAEEGIDATDKPQSLTFGEDGFEVGSDNEEDEDDVDSADGADSESDEDDAALANGVDDETGNDDSNDDVEDEISENEIGDEEGHANEESTFGDEDEEDENNEFVQDPNGLNDGFFSIDAFNKQTQLWEDQDARGDAATDQDSDDEDINWGADPLAPSKPSGKTSKRTRSQVETTSGDEEDEDEEDGPTFGNMSLDAPEGASDDEDLDPEDEDGSDANANEIYYKDFFAPPARKDKKGKPRGKKAVHFEPEEVRQQDMERAMGDVKRDLFEDDDSDNEGSDDALSDVSAGDIKSRRSTHERRQAKLAEEIRKLEAASVAKREWTLSGEATAVDRPVNSLIEEDLDFEHVGKPVPVITPEVSESIEDLVKRRILSQEFDEVLRRRPNTDGLPANATRRGLVEVDDSKASKGLAEIYEEEHVKQANPDTYMSQSDEKLQKEEKEIEAMWRDVSGRLDALSSWHYKPRPAAATLSVVSDIATISMEDAQPSTAQGIAGAEAASRMAPQEMYKAGESAAGEVVTKAGLPLAREELSREEKTRRRRRHKERLRKAGGVDGAAGAGRQPQQQQPGRTRAQMQRDTVAELRKGGVKVINRKGEITDVDGNKARAKRTLGSGAFKL